MSFHKVRAGRWQSTASAYRIEARGPRCFAILLDGRIVAQAGTIEGAMAEVLRIDLATYGRRRREAP